MEEEFNQQGSQAPFNMAIATLQALRSLLDDIKKLYEDPRWDDGIKQKLKIDLVRRFYIDSSPLLDEDIVKTYKEILDIKPSFALERSSGKKRYMFDWELEKKLEQFLLDIQRELQKERYYMPPKKDLGRAVGSFR